MKKQHSVSLKYKVAKVVGENYLKVVDLLNQYNIDWESVGPRVSTGTAMSQYDGEGTINGKMFRIRTLEVVGGIPNMTIYSDEPNALQILENTPLAELIQPVK